jgi:uncharacterized protein YecE (DUF72 family)
VGEVLVGTSGWAYATWVGTFYPKGTTAARMLRQYGTRLPTVEAHSTYRRLPSATTLARWARQVPGGFRFAPKAHVGITHRRDLVGVEDRVRAFFDAVGGLAARLGPVLFQLPHQHPDLDRLDALLSALPPDAPAAFELAPPWLEAGTVEDVTARMEARRATIALVETDNQPAPDIEIGPFTYARLRRTRYGAAELERWAERLAKLKANGREAYVYLRHDDDGLAPVHAQRLMEGLT